MPTIQKLVASCWSGTHTLTCSSATMLPTSCRRRSYVFDGIVLGPPQKGTLSLNAASPPRGGPWVGEGRAPCLQRPHGPIMAPPRPAPPPPRGPPPLPAAGAAP